MQQNSDYIFRINKVMDYIESNFGKHVYVIGKNFNKTTTKNSTHSFSSFEDLKPILKGLNLTNSTVLIKGSRGMALERVLDLL